MSYIYFLRVKVFTIEKYCKLSLLQTKFVVPNHSSDKTDEDQIDSCEPTVKQLI